MSILFEDIIVNNSNRNTNYETVSKAFYKIATHFASTPPPSWGQELEVPDEENQWIYHHLYEIIGGAGGAHQDGSGPAELMYGPQPFGNSLFVSFLSVLIANNIITVYPDDEMGNHIHVRPRNFAKLIKISTAFLLPALPLLSSHIDGSVYYFRPSVLKWTGQFTELEYYLKSLARNEFNSIIREYQGREYCVFTLNRHNKTILTLEYRISEALPLKAYTFIQLIKFLLKNTKIKIIANVNEIAREVDNLHEEYKRVVDEGIVLDDKFRIPKIFSVVIGNKKIEEITPKNLVKMLSTNTDDVIVNTVIDSMLNFKPEPISSDDTKAFIKSYPAVREKIINDLRKIKSLLVSSS